MKGRCPFPRERNDALILAPELTPVGGLSQVDPAQLLQRKIGYGIRRVGQQNDRVMAERNRVKFAPLLVAELARDEADVDIGRESRANGIVGAAPAKLDFDVRIAFGELLRKPLSQGSERLRAPDDDFSPRFRCLGRADGKRGDEKEERRESGVFKAMLWHAAVLNTASGDRLSRRRSERQSGPGF